MLWPHTERMQKEECNVSIKPMRPFSAAHVRGAISIQLNLYTHAGPPRERLSTKPLHAMESLSRQPDLDRLLYQSAIAGPSPVTQQAGAGHAVALATAATVLTPEKADAPTAGGREEVQIKLVDKLQAVTCPVEAAAIGGSARGAENLDATSQLEEAGAGALDIAQRRALLLGRTKQRHVCLQCGRECPSKHKLKRHLSTHSEQRPYNCHLCGKSFKWTEYLAKHMRTQHPGAEGESWPSSPPCSTYSLCILVRGRGRQRERGVGDCCAVYGCAI